MLQRLLSRTKEEPVPAGETVRADWSVSGSVGMLVQKADETAGGQTRGRHVPPVIARQRVSISLLGPSGSPACAHFG